MNGCVGGNGARGMLKGENRIASRLYLDHVGIDSDVDTILSGSWFPRWYLVFISWPSGLRNPSSR